METVIAIVAFAVCALAFESSVTKVDDGPVSDSEFAAAVEWEMQASDEMEASDGMENERGENHDDERTDDGAN